MIFSQWHKSSTAAGLKAACRAVAHFKKDPAWPPPRGTASRAFSVPSGRTTMMRSLPPLSADPPSFPNLSFLHRNENIWLHIYSSSTSTSIFGSVYYCSNCLIATRAACSCFRQTEVKVPEWFVALANKTELLLAAKFTDKSIMHPNSEAFFFWVTPAGFNMRLSLRFTAAVLQLIFPFLYVWQHAWCKRGKHWTPLPVSARGGCWSRSGGAANNTGSISHSVSSLLLTGSCASPVQRRGNASDLNQPVYQTHRTEVGNRSADITIVFFLVLISVIIYSGLSVSLLLICLCLFCSKAKQESFYWREEEKMPI